MLPVLFSVGKISVSSFGFFLVLGLLYGVFLIWRLARAWDLDEEKTLDLMLLTFIGGLFGARLYFTLEHLFLFTNPLNFILINKVPGLNFWGGFLGGWLSLSFFSRRFRLDFWQLADIALVGLLGGLIFSSLGCFLGSCNSGKISNMFLAVTQEGLIGKRWPVQAAESALLIFALTRIWAKAIHFHQRGKVASLGFIYIGIINLMLEPVRQDHSGFIFSLVLILLGVTLYYKVTGQNPVVRLKALGKFLVKLASSPETQKSVLQSLFKYWYNQKTLIIWKLRNIKKSFRRSHVKLS